MPGGLRCLDSHGSETGIQLQLLLVLTLLPSMEGAMTVPEQPPLPRSTQAELGRLLRACRERLLPEDVGLAPGVRRRTRGLRREEVALLANVSTTYYTFLEQGRNVRPSRQVLDALARVLHLSGAEHALLHQLAHGAPPTDQDARAEELAPGVAALVDRMDPYPTYVTGRRWDVLAANRAACALFTDWPTLPPGERNILWFMFTDPRARTIYVEWEREASAQLGRFRAVAARRPDDPEFVEFTERLLNASPEARRWWSRHDVLPLSSGTKRLRHDTLGELTVQHLVLQVADAPDQKLVTFSSSPPDDKRLLRLAS
jgi:transcriptional regulator with XRE-family HTH domain